MKINRLLTVTILIYCIVFTSLIMGLSLPSGDSFLERVLVSSNMPVYTKDTQGLYIPGAQLFVVIFLSWLALKWLYRNQVTLWKNGLLLLIVIVVVSWKIILY